MVLQWYFQVWAALTVKCQRVIVWVFLVKNSMELNYVTTTETRNKCSMNFVPKHMGAPASEAAGRRREDN